MRIVHSLSDYVRDRLRSDRQPHIHPADPPPRSSLLKTIARVNRQPRTVFRPTHKLTQGTEVRQSRQVITKPIARTRHVEGRQPVAPGREQTQEPTRSFGLEIDPEGNRLLLEVGRFRVIALADLAREIYGGNTSRLRNELELLKQKRLVQCHFLHGRRDGRTDDARRFEAVTLTKTGQKRLAKTGQMPEGQRIYSGLVKPREAEHDTEIFRAFLKEAAAIEQAGGKNIRVRLDFELEAKINRAISMVHKAHPQKDPDQIKSEIAQAFGLTLKNNKVVLPDARLEYDLPDGTPGQMDLEVVTSAYRHGQIAAKVQAGFKIYMSKGDIGRLGASVLDDHDLMSGILDI